MWLREHSWEFLVFLIIIAVGVNLNHTTASSHRILVDTDLDTDDFFALLYLLKLNKSEFDIKV